LHPRGEAARAGSRRETLAGAAIPDDRGIRRQAPPAPAIRSLSLPADPRLAPPVPSLVARAEAEGLHPRSPRSVGGDVDRPLPRRGEPTRTAAKGARGDAEEGARGCADRSRVPRAPRPAARLRAAASHDASSHGVPSPRGGERPALPG